RAGPFGRGRQGIAQGASAQPGQPEDPRCVFPISTARPASGAACRDRSKSLRADQDCSIGGVLAGTADALPLWFVTASVALPVAVFPAGFFAATLERPQRAATTGRRCPSARSRPAPSS